MNSEKNYEGTILWHNVLWSLVSHLLALQGLYLMLTFGITWQSYIWFFVLLFASSQGVTAGAHRLWSHKAYKATLPLQLLLAFFQTMSFQFSIYSWARNHRVHHKYSDTDADPHNASKGFYFSHIGWLFVQPHPEFIEKRKAIDDSDLLADPIVYYQYKYYKVLSTICCFIIPTFVPWYYWDEKLYSAFVTAAVLRFMLVLHSTFLINSAAHLWGNRPYDKNIKPSQNLLVSMLIAGEGWHNYHHTFPWDYKAEELGGYLGNWSTAFIDFMEKIGWAYDLKTAGHEMVQTRKRRTGDGK